MTYNQKNKEYAEKILAIDKVMLSSLKGKDLSDYMIFRSNTGRDQSQGKITPKKAYSNLVSYSEDNLRLREDNVRRGIECILSDAEEATYKGAGLRIASSLRQLDSVLD